MPRDPQNDQDSSIELLEGKITVANRAPHSKDKGRFWVYQTASSAVLYVRSSISGNWYAQA